MSDIPVFWIEPTERVLRALRRYSSRQGDTGWTCAEGWHQAKVTIEPVEGVPIRRDHEESDPREVGGDSWDHDDPRWPLQCEKGCGYVFSGDDVWQLFTERAYRRADGASNDDLTLVMHDETRCPPGAMWDAWWYPWKGPDGMSLTVQLPDGTYWCVDAPATGGGRWTRTGDPKADPPTIDVNPSIASGHPETYHGHLRHGRLVPV